jgi:hypothetical protein
MNKQNSVTSQIGSELTQDNSQTTNVLSSKSRNNVIQNRTIVEFRRKQLTSNNHATENIAIVQELGNNSFSDKSSAAQIEPNRYLETRLVSPEDIKRRAIESIKRTENKRRELLLENEPIDND